MARSRQWRLRAGHIYDLQACFDTGLCRGTPDACTDRTGIALNNRGSSCATSQIFRFFVKRPNLPRHPLKHGRHSRDRREAGALVPFPGGPVDSKGSYWPLVGTTGQAFRGHRRCGTEGPPREANGPGFTPGRAELESVRLLVSQSCIETRKSQKDYLNIQRPNSLKSP